MRVGFVIALGVLLTLGAFACVSAPASAWEIDRTDAVTRVIDGDTFNCSLPTGVRLADIDAPEYDEVGYQESKDYLTALIAGQTVYLDIDDVYGTDTYGRWVAVVYVRHNSTYLLNVNQAMLDAGHAVIWEFTNEFSPATWSRYAFYPVDAPAPTVTATADLTEGFAPLTVAFMSTASGGIPPYAYVWTFGDGGTSSAPSPSHTFLIGGTFSVRLTVSDAAQRSGSKTVLVTVHAPVSVTPSVDTIRGVVPLRVSFTATATDGSPPYTYRWTFGDGNTSTDPNPSHTYTVPGTYTATVTVTDSLNRTDAESLQVTASVPTPPPIIAPAEAIGAAAVGFIGVAVVAYVLVRRTRRQSR